MLHPKTPATQPSTPPGDRSPLTALYTREAELHLQLIRSRPTPALLREIAAVQARLNRGAR